MTCESKRTLSRGRKLTGENGANCGKIGYEFYPNSVAFDSIRIVWLFDSIQIWCLVFNMLPSHSSCCTKMCSYMQILGCWEIWAGYTNSLPHPVGELWIGFGQSWQAFRAQFKILCNRSWDLNAARTSPAVRLILMWLLSLHICKLGYLVSQIHTITYTCAVTKPSPDV